MTTDSILITGSSGVLGWHLCQFFSSENYAVSGHFRRNRPTLEGVTFDCIPLEEPERIVDYLNQNSFKTIVHSAAVTNPDDCEKDPANARAINVDATRVLTGNLPEETRLVYISTDLVFDGHRGGYTEDDQPNPVNLYGETKLEAENIVRQRENSVVLRVAKLYSSESPFSGSFESWMRDHFTQGIRLNLFVDQFRTPVYVGDVARALKILSKTRPCSSLYHLGGAARVSRLEFGRVFSEVFGYDASLIEPTQASKLGLVARGQDCSLDSSRFRDEFGFNQSSLIEGFQKMKEGSY